MGKNSDIESASNSISNTLLHEILIDYSNKPESLTHLTSEEIEYQGQSMKKVSKVNFNDKDKKIVRNKVIKKIINRLKTKYSDVVVPKSIIQQRVDEELPFFFN